MKRAAVVVAAAVLLASCTGDDDEPSAASTSTAPTTSTTTAPAREPAATPSTLEGPITVGTISPPADPRAVDLDAIGYTQEEFFASGTATAYAAAGELPEDGTWTVEPTTTAPYKTRIVVRRPSDPSRFNGTVVLEWLNVTVVEAAPEWAYTNRAITDAGAAWVGVSAQALGIVGGSSIFDTGDAQQEQLRQGIRATNPERYGSLDHPGDAYAFDIFSQIAAGIRAPGDVPVLGQSEARRVIAAGESQSAAYLTTYIDAVQPLANAFDGFFVHSRGAGATQPDGTLDIRGSTGAYRFRTDLDAPVMAFETETDVGPLLAYAAARQPDTDHLRTWEVAGTSHADAYLVGGNSFGPCPSGINDGPQHYVATAAMAALLAWVDDGTAPPHADPIETGGDDGTTVVRDEHGIAVGGIRTPSVDVPVETLSGEAPVGAPTLCMLFGSATPFDAATLASLYPSQQAYLDAFDASLDATVEAGFVRAADRDEYAAEARAVQL